MKITKAQLKQIIKEEMKGRLGEAFYGPADPGHPEHEGFLKWKSQQKPSALERELEMRPSLERRVDRLEEKLDEIIRSLSGTAATQVLGTGTQVELEEQK